MELRKAVDNLYLYDPQFEPAAKRFLGEMGGSSASHAIRNWDDVLTALTSFSLVKFLVFDTHGLPGTICLPDGGRAEGIDFMAIPVGPGFFQKDARILFLGCNAGEGAAGDRFLNEIGVYLLRGKGGIVGATTSANLVFQLGNFASESYMHPFEQGRLKVKRYDMSGRQIGSNTVNRYGSSG